jgi:hypothetical protein
VSPKPNGGTPTTPNAEQVRALAPDPSVARSGEQLASRRHWHSLGRSERATWGLCQGSGKAPYQVAVDLTAPAFACTPDLFPDLMAAAISRRDIALWASEQGIAAERTKETT